MFLAVDRAPNCRNPERTISLKTNTNTNTNTMKMKCLRYGALSAIFCLPIQAAITMTAWNFEGIAPLDEYGSSVTNTITGWTEFDTSDNFHDWAVQTTGGTFGSQFADTGIVVGFSKVTEGGFIRRSIGTMVGGETSISFALDVVERNNRNDWGAITISLTGSSSGPIGTFVLNPNNASFTVANDILLQQAAGTFSLSALPAQELFLRISNSSGSDDATQESFIDNVTATVIPEPSAALLGGLGLLALLRRRRA